MEIGTLVQVHVTCQVICHATHIKPLGSAGSIYSYRVIDGERIAEGKRHLLTLLRPLGRLYRWGVVGTIAEVIHLVGGHHYRIGCLRCSTGKVHIDIVRTVTARFVFRIEQGISVAYGMDTMMLTAAVQCVYMRVLGQRSLHINALKHRLDILPFARLVVLACRPVAHLLLIQNLKYSLGGHNLTQSGCIRLQFRFKVGKDKTPEHTCIALEGVFALFCVPGLTVHIVLVGKEAVVSHKVGGIAIVEQNIPHLAVKGYPDHILHTLVEAGVVVCEHIEGTHPARVEIHRSLVLELLALER